MSDNEFMSFLHGVKIPAAGLLWITLAAGFPAGAVERSSPIPAQVHREAVDHLYNLEFDDAIGKFHFRTTLEPDLPASYAFLAYALMLKEIDRRGEASGIAHRVGSPYCMQAADGLRRPQNESNETFSIIRSEGWQAIPGRFPNAPSWVRFLMPPRSEAEEGVS